MPTKLSAEQGFLMSRLNDKTRIKDLLPLCPWPEQQTLALLEELLQQNFLEKLQEASGFESQKLETIESQLAELCKNKELQWMKLDLQKEILLKTQSLSTASPYDILETRKIATSSEIKNSYLKLSRKYHPDRFFRKPLGPFKVYLTKIFEAIQAAYSQLKDPHEREIVDRKLRTASKSEGPSKPKTTKRKKKLGPLVEKIGKAEKFYKDGQIAEEAGHYIAATNAYQLAYQTNPQKSVYQEAYERILPFLKKEKAHSLLEQAKNAEQLSMYEEVLKRSEEALRHLPESAEANLLAAKAIIELKDKERFSDAKEMFLRAKARLPQSADPCIQLGRLYFLQGQKDHAMKAYKEALKREPENRSAQKLLDKLT